MDIGELATVGASGGGAFVLLNKLADIGIAWVKRRNGNGKADTPHADCPPAVADSMRDLAAAVEKSGHAAERGAEAMDRLHDAITANGGKLDRVLDRLQWMRESKP